MNKRLRSLFSKVKRLIPDHDLILHIPSKTNKTLADCFGLICEYSDKSIIVVVQVRNKSGKYYSWRFIKSTLAHELAHMEGQRHGPKHSRLQRKFTRLLNKLERCGG